MSVPTTSAELRALALSDRIEEFEAAIESLLASPNAANAGLLAGALTDDDDYLDEMWSIVHALETMPRDNYLRGLLSALESPDSDDHWLWMLVCRLAGDADTFSSFLRHVETAHPTAINRLQHILSLTGLPDEMTPLVKLLS